jgi:hypothetical protein
MAQKGNTHMVSKLILIGNFVINTEHIIAAEMNPAGELRLWM